MELRLCPIIRRSNLEISQPECMGETCAWWDGGVVSGRYDVIIRSGCGIVPRESRRV
jgi:hypothetical protein